MNRQQPSDSGWVVVMEWSGGAGRRRTEAFAPSSRPWRLSFEASGDALGVLDIFVRTLPGEELVAAAVSQQASREESLAGTLLVEAEHDEYFVEITSYRLNWRLAVEVRHQDF